MKIEKKKKNEITKMKSLKFVKKKRKLLLIFNTYFILI